MSRVLKKLGMCRRLSSRVHTGHGKPGKSKNFMVSLCRPGIPKIEVWVTRSHGKAINVLRIDHFRIRDIALELACNRG